MRVRLHTLNVWVARTARPTAVRQSATNSARLRLHEGWGLSACSGEGQKQQVISLENRWLEAWKSACHSLWLSAERTGWSYGRSKRNEMWKTMEKSYLRTNFKNLWSKLKSCQLTAFGTSCSPFIFMHIKFQWRTKGMSLSKRQVRWWDIGKVIAVDKNTVVTKQH